MDLVWEAPAECPQKEAVEKRLRAITGEVWYETHALRVEGRIAVVSQGYRLTIVVRDGSSVQERSIESRSCADLGGAGAVAIGLLLATSPDPPPADPRGAGASSSGTPGTEPGTKADTGDPNAKAETSSRTDARGKREEEPRTDAPPSSDDERHLYFIARVPIATLDLVRVPGASFGVGAGLGARYDEWRVLGTAHMLLPKTLSSPNFPEIGVRVRRITADISGCRGIAFDSVELAPCLILGLDHLTARAAGQDVVARSRSALSFVIGVGGVAHLHLTDWAALVLAASAGVETSRPTLVVDGLGGLRKLGPAEVSARVGSEWIF